MESLLSKINTRLNYINNNSDNAYIHNQTRIINEKMQYFKDRAYKEEQTVIDACDNIIYRDIHNMKHVQEQTNMVYRKMDELAGFVEQIKTVYFEEV